MSPALIRTRTASPSTCLLYLFWLFRDSTMLVFSSFISTLLGMSFSVSLLSTDRDFEGSPGPGEGQRESQEGLAQTPHTLEQQGAIPQPNPSGSSAAMGAASPCPALSLPLPILT